MKVQVFKGPSLVREIEVGTDFATIGRGDQASIRLEDRAVSREHARVRVLSDGSLEVECLSHVGALQVNGVATDRGTVRGGEHFEVGPFRFLLAGGQALPVSANASPPTPAPADALSVSIGSASAPAIPGYAEVEGRGNDAGLQPGLQQGIQESPAGLALDGSESGREPELKMGELGVSDSDVSPAELATGMFSAPQGGSGYVEDPAGDGATRVTTMMRLAVSLQIPPGVANVSELGLTKPETVIGRAEGCDVILLADKKVSRKNTVIKKLGSTFVVEDLGSSNGTLVNGERIQGPRELAGDDVLRIGDVEMIFKATSKDYAEKAQDFMSVPDEPEEIGLPLEMGGAEPAMLPPMVGMEQNSGSPAPFGESPLPMPAIGTGGFGVPSGATNFGGGAAMGGKLTLADRFKALSKPTQIVLAIGAAVFVYWIVEDEVFPPAPQQTVAEKSKEDDRRAPASANEDPRKKKFEQLSPEDQKWVQSQYELAKDLFSRGDFSQSLYEFDKITQKVSDYRDTVYYMRYNREKLRVAQAQEDEKKKKESEEALQRKVADLVGITARLMQQKKWQEAEPNFQEILSMDPENKVVASWKAEIEAVRTEERRKEEEKRARDLLNKTAWDAFREADKIRKSGKCLDAIPELEKVKEMAATTKGPAKAAEQSIRACRSFLKAMIDPLLADAKKASDEQDLATAYKAFEKVVAIIPGQKDAELGMNEIRGVLHARAKHIYTEAVVAESFSDFDTAKKKFKEVLTVAPKDDPYFERAETRLSKYRAIEDQQKEPE